MTTHKSGETLLKLKTLPPVWQGGSSPAIFTSEEWQAICRCLKLTDRQCQIVSGVLRGQKVECVAQDLGICHDTVRAHLRQVYHKLKVRDRMELLVRCVMEFRCLYFPKKL